jgi:hypothetical protein
LKSSAVFVHVHIVGVDIGFVILAAGRVLGKLLGFRIKEQGVADPGVSSGVTVGAGTFPNHLIPELFLPEYPIQHKLEVMTRRRVTMQVKAAGGLEDPVQLKEPTMPGHKFCKKIKIHA